MWFLAKTLTAQTQWDYSSSVRCNHSSADRRCHRPAAPACWSQHEVRLKHLWRTGSQVAQSWQSARCKSVKGSSSGLWILTLYLHLDYIWTSMWKSGLHHHSHCQMMNMCVSLHSQAHSLQVAPSTRAWTSHSISSLSQTTLEVQKKEHNYLNKPSIAPTTAFSNKYNLATRSSSRNTQSKHLGDPPVGKRWRPPLTFMDLCLLFTVVVHFKCVFF